MVTFLRGFASIVYRRRLDGSGSDLNPKKLLRNGFVHNVIALYGVQAATYALPLLTFPYLARVLGPSGWGIVVFAQAIGAVIASVVEYGFDISASRETSRQRNEPERLSALISGVLGAKVLLAVLCIGGALFSRPFTHHAAPPLALFSPTPFSCHSPPLHTLH